MKNMNMSFVSRMNLSTCGMCVLFSCLRILKFEQNITDIFN